MTVNELKNLPELKRAVDRQADACQSAKDAIAFLQAGIERITARISLAGGSGGEDRDKLAEFVARKEDYEAQLHRAQVRHDEMLAHYEILRAEAYAFILTLTAVEAEVITARYLSDDWARRGKWEGLARRMHMTVDGLHSARRRAEINSGIRIGTSALILSVKEPESSIAPRDFCAFIILSVSSIRVGIKRRAIVIIIAIS